MRTFTLIRQKAFYVFAFLLLGNFVKGQVVPVELKLSDFAVWGGSASPNSYKSTQGVFIKEKAIIQGSIGTNHLVDISKLVTLTGNIYSGNGIVMNESARITGNITANKTASNFSGNVITGSKKSIFEGNLTAKGKIAIAGTGADASFVRGQVAVPAPTSTNYSGPAPRDGFTNTFTLPVLPTMPAITNFDKQVGTTNVTGTQALISPGKYGKMALTGNKTITFNGPGNYIFNEIDNGNTTNKFIFDFKGTTEGTINIFVVKDARWGKLSVKTANGNHPDRVFTEVHGTGGTGGFAFDLSAPDAMPAASYAWLGNVWAPNGGITVKNLRTSTIPHVVGALWSGIKVELNQNLVLSYQAPAFGTGPDFIEPYYAPPVDGKVTEENKVIGAELLALSQNPAPINSIPDNEIFILDNAGKVLIEVISKTANDVTLRNELIALGMTGLIDNGPHIYIISGYFPINQIMLLRTNPKIEYVRPLYPPISNRGQVTTQGDTTMRSYIVREQFGLDGSGVKIGVISDSYNFKLTAQDDVNQGDLPGIKTTGGDPNENTENVQLVGPTPLRGNDEGRAMLQIVHDVAPMAKLAFRTGFLSAGDFARGILELASPTLLGGRCDVIVDDITYITEPFLTDGRVAQAVDQVVAQDVTYVTSAGNFGNKSYEGVFNGVINTSIIPVGQIHQFGTTPQDIYQNVNLKPGTYTIVLQWSDEFHSLGSTTGVQTDMDLYLVGTTGFTLFGFNRSNLFGDPFEVCPFTVEEETNARIMVVRAAGATNVRFKLIMFRGDGTLLDYQTGTSSIVGHANANGAITVGAMLYKNIPGVTPIWPGVASFSSRGGTNTFQGGSFVVRNKPDIIGPNGVNTTVNLGGAPFNDGDPYPNFFGTSASAPHVAAVGGLLIQGRKKFNLQTTVTPAEIKQQLLSSTGKFSYLPNFSYEGGNGFVQADSAAQQISNPAPLIKTLTATIPGSQNGIVPFEVTITGEYLTSTTQLYIDSVPVPTTVSADFKSAKAIVPAIVSGENPLFQLGNAAKSPSGLDGGLSNQLFFFGSRIPVRIVAQNAERKYGQTNPSFVANVLVNGVPIDESGVTLADLKLDGNNISFTTIATTTSTAGVYGIFPSRTTPLPIDDPLFTQYAFSFVSGALSVGKMPVKITPQNMTLKYGEFPDIVYNYELAESPANSATILEEVKALHKQYLADNALIVINGAGGQNPPVSESDLLNMSTIASFQSVYNARNFVLENGQLKAIVNNLDLSQIGDQRFVIDVAAQSIQNYTANPNQTTLEATDADPDARGFLNIKSLTNGTARAAVPNGQLQAMVNGQLMAMVNGQLQALVNGQLQALVNNVYVNAEDLVFQNGQLLALVNGVWSSVSNGQLQAIVNGAAATIELSVSNGQLQAVVNGQLMALVNGQLQAVVNGQLVAMVNGQLKAIVNGQLMPLVNGQLVAVVNGQLQPMVNGQLVAIVNGQLMALVNGQLELVQDLSLVNGQLQAIVNGQLKALVNGQLKAMVNGTVEDVPTTSVNIVNGQLQALVNGQLVAMVNGQLLAVVNGQLKALVNGAAIEVESVIQLANGQLKAIVNGEQIPIANGQLQALVNGQLMAMVNGQLMAVVNGELTFVVFQNGQLKALVNGQLQALVNGQLQAVVNGELQTVNSADVSIVNGQLRAIVNGETWVFPNGQLKALVNGQLQALVNNFDVSGTNNNAKTLVLVDEDDINLQAGDVGGMFSVNMITGLNVGTQKLIPGAFVHENFEVTYGLGQVEILPTLLTTKPDNKTRIYGDPNPAFTISYNGFAYGETDSDITPPVASTNATTNSNVGTYPINVTGGSSNNYSFGYSFPGTLTITPKSLTVTADDKVKQQGQANPAFTITYNGFVGDDNKDSVCIPYFIPPAPRTIDQFLRLTTYTNLTLNGTATTIYEASPGEQVTLNFHSVTVYNDLTNYCPGCITQLYIGMAGPGGVPVFDYCYDVSLYALTGPGSSLAADRSIVFNAPTVPGVYYITQEGSWQYFCHGGNEGYPTNDASKAIAVIVVNISGTEITASSIADELSPIGTYPITLQGCSFYNPNYNVSLQNGILTVTGVSARPGTGASQSLATGEEKTGDGKILSNRMYPNPALSKVRLELKDDVQTTDLQVYDIVGKVNAIPIRKTGPGSHELDVSRLTKGVYFIKAKTANGFQTFRFVKM